MIKFNSDNIIVGEIKQLLKTFNLPTCKVFVPGMFVLEGELYLHGLHLYRARKSGFLSEVNKENFETLQSYKYGEKIPGITKTYALDSLIYDEHLHRYLGEYLRFYSDYYGINLMSLYNCFTNRLIPYMSFGKVWVKEYQDVLVETESGKQEVEVEWEESGTRPVMVELLTISTDYNSISNTTNFKVYSVPINLFKEYTIGIDCDTAVELILDFYDQDRELTVVNKAVMDKLHTYSYVVKNGTMFSRPFVYSKALFKDIDFGESVLKEFMKQEPNFKLLIKVPSQCSSSISVVEGNYLKNCERVFETSENGKLKVGNVQVVSNDTPSEVYSYPTKMELFRLNTQTQHPFATRLIEYLVDNVISVEDSTSKNIERVQLSLYHPKVIDGTVNRRLPIIENRGIWQKEIKEAIYKDSVRENTINKYFDLLYYVDKDVETDIIKEASD